MKTRRSFPWLGLFILAVLAVAGWFGWQRWAPRAAALPKFRTTAVTRGNIVQSVTANGNIQPMKSVTVGSQVSGQITDVFADFNTRVTNGQVLAKIDPSTFERALQQSDAELASAHASLALAKVNRDRARDLMAANLIPKSDGDQAEATFLQAEASVKMRQANVERARVDLDRTTIYSPIKGIVISRKIDQGQTVAASLNTPNLFLIVGDLARVQIEVAVSEADIGGVLEGQRVTFQVDAFPNRTFNGSVRQVRFEAITNQNVITYTTVVDVGNDDLKLRPGMTANVSIITAEQSNVLRVPNAALRFRPPEGAILRGDTNAPAMTGAGTNAPALATGGGAPTGAEGMPQPPWAAEGRRPTSEEREKWMATLTPEQRDAMQKMRERMRGGDGGPGGGEGGGGRPRAQRQAQPEGPVNRTVHVLAKETDAAGQEIEVLKATVIKTGASDATSTEIIEGLSEGDQIVTGVAVATTASAPPAAASGSPLGGGPFGGGGQRPR